MVILWSTMMPEPAKREQREPVLPWLAREDRPCPESTLEPEDDVARPELSLEKHSEPNVPSRDETPRPGGTWRFCWRGELGAEAAVALLAAFFPNDVAATPWVKTLRTPPRPPPSRSSRTHRCQTRVRTDACGVRVLARGQQA